MGRTESGFLFADACRGAHRWPLHGSRTSELPQANKRGQGQMEERLIAIVAAALRVPASALTLQTGPGDLEAWDSLAQLNVVAEIEVEFGVSIPIEQMGE